MTPNVDDDGAEPMNAGLRDVDLTDPVQGERIPLRVLYPTRAPSRVERLGPYAVEIAVGAPPEGDRLPLVVISHGTGGSPLTYRDLAVHLARSGFVVALPVHPGNNRDDDRLAGTAENLVNRPRHLQLAIDAAYADDEVGARLARDGVAVVGHSMGGYTALALAGGNPSAFAHQTADGLPHPVAVAHDARVHALVLLAPATAWFLADGALENVDLPILMWTAENDEHAPAFHADIVERGVRDPRRVDRRVVANAGHFAFQSPFPESMRQPGFAPAQDPAGFDRAAFQPILHGAIARFLRDHL